MEKTLYKRNSNKSIEKWTIYVEGSRYWTVYGKLDGKEITSAPKEIAGKNTGKKNSTTDEVQALKDAEAIIKKRLKKHYFENIDDIDNIAYISPMLAHKWAEHRHKITFPALCDPKLDGHRATDSREYGMRTRSGEKIIAVPHIKFECDTLRINNPDIVLDGEMYNHEYRNALNEIAKIMRVTKPEKLTPAFLAKSKEMIQYWVYDGWGFNTPSTGVLITEDTPFRKRRDALIELLGTIGPTIRAVEYTVTNDWKEMGIDYDALIELEFEGHIIRYGECLYKRGRSHNLIKHKDFMDDEFIVIGFEEGVGKAKGLAFKAICLTKPTEEFLEPQEFRPGLNLTRAEMKNIWENQDKYIGMWLNVRFLKYSVYGIPSIPKGRPREKDSLFGGKMFRTDHIDSVY